MSSRLEDKRIVVIPDVHLPDHHRPAIANVFKFIKDFQPDQVHFVGDLYDMKPVARWSRETAAECGKMLQVEQDVGYRFLSEFREHFDGLTTLTIGNHEVRLRSYLMKYAQGLDGLRALELAEFCHFDKFNIKVMPQPYTIAPGVAAIHGDKLGITAGASALKELRRHGRSIVQGHSHRLGVVYHTTDRRRFAAEFGWLGDIRKASYLSYGVADWSLGFGLLTVTPNETVPELIPVQPNGSFTVRGVKYA